MKRSLRASNRGFTLVEVMVVIIIIGILVAVAVMNMINAQHRARVATIKSNMHALETLVVVYSSDWDGVFPLNVQAILDEGQTRKYWKDFENPYFASAGLGISYTDEAGTKKEGIVTFEPVSPSLTKYYIYGYDQYLNRVQQNNQDFVLTNS